MIPEDAPPPTVADELLAKLQDAIKAQLRREGVAEGTPVSMHRYRLALLASPEASEIAHQIYELPYVKQTQDKLPCGLKELAVPVATNAGHPTESCNGNGTAATETTP